MQWNIRDDAPVYAQLVEHIKLAIISGEFKLGERLPSVRELSAEAGVNPNTMQRAMAELEQSGLIYSQRTSGRFVTDDRAVIDEARLRMARRQAEVFWHSMAGLGYDRARALEILTEQKEEIEEANP